MAVGRPLAYCPTCKIAFPIAPRAEGGTLVFQNSTTTCPNGHFARILNAHYQAFEAEIQAMLESNGRAAHRAALALWNRVRASEITAEQARAEVERTRPGLQSIFDAANFSDPVKKAILDALITAFVVPSGHDEEPSIEISPTPEARALADTPEKRKGGNRAFQRSLRHKQRMLMNPRAR
jgi:hypothetical protein